MLQFLRERRLFKPCLNVIFAYLQEEKMHQHIQYFSRFFQECETSLENIHRQFRFSSLFLHENAANYVQLCHEGISCFVSMLLWRVVRMVPLSFRSWFLDIRRDPVLGAAVERLVKESVSRRLIEEELASAVARASELENLSVSVSSASRMITARYQQEEVEISISIVLPDTYPLSKLSVSVSDTQGQAIAKKYQASWVGKMNISIFQQDGSIAKAIETWFSNLHKMFDGVEACPICYSILHPSSGDLPAISCSTCRNRYHSACLFKWFRTSQNSSCPMCRAAF